MLTIYRDNSNSSILTKGVGIGALIKIMYFLFVNLFVNEWKLKPDFISTVSKDDLVKKLKGIEKVDFSKSGEFGGVGSGGSINKLAQRLVEQIDFFGGNKYPTFLATYKNSTLKDYQAWFKDNVK